MRHHPDEAALVKRFEAAHPGAKFRVLMYIDDDMTKDEIVRVECFTGGPATGMAQMHPADLLLAMDDDARDELLDRMATRAHEESMKS